MIKLKYKKTVLGNGLRIIVVPMKNTSTVTSIVFVKTGSRYEQKRENGISHVLEHMFFEGTKKRPDKLGISRELDRIGAMSNAFTAHDKTAYYIKADSKYLDLSLDILSDMYLNALLNPKDIETERRVIVEEINMCNDNPQGHVWDNLYKIVYKNNSLGWPIAGPIKTVLSLNREDLANYTDKFYSAKNTVVVVAGNVNEESTIQKIKKYFKNIKNGPSSTFPLLIDEQKNLEIDLDYKKIDQAHLVLGVKTYSVFDKRKYTLDVLSSILGGYSSSRLFMSVRNHLGLAYYVGTSSNHHEDTGLFAVYAGINLKNIELGIKAILAELKKVKSTLIPEKEIADAKSHIEGILGIQLESSNNIAQMIGDSEIILGKEETPEEYLANIRKVTAADLKAVANDIFKTTKLNFALIGPFKDKNRFAKILKI